MTIDGESGEDSILISRVQMEDNMFSPTRQQVPRIRIESTHSTYRPGKIEKLNGIYTLAIVIAQIVMGVLGNSLTLIADATRVFADHLEQYRFDRSATPGKRLTEIISVGITVIVLFVLFVAYILSASARAATLTYDINRVYLIIGTGLAMTANTLQTLCHFKTWRRDHTYTITLYSFSKRNQLIHGYGYHFIASFVLVSSFLIIVDKNYLIADVITTYITSLLLLCNLSSTGYRLYHEYFSLEHPQDEYESI
ncbi:unnamed protein product [Caenorhabditis angaria]|uniref:Uncharacterized protein n=1 Tax=Caenorhabditis angaria TaxID=860376 RepID=A0A9P1IZV5_9PELO|nr:unnamed protein product [Caenorhabditis angaria]